MHRLRLAKLTLIAATILLTVRIASGGESAALVTSAAGRLVWDAFKAQPSGFVSLGLQLLVVLALHVVLLWGTFRLAAVPSRFDARTLVGRPTFQLVATWLAVMWLLVDANNRGFPGSAWHYATAPITESPGGLPMRVLAAGWLLMKFVDAGLATLRRFAALPRSRIVLTGVAVAAMPAIAWLPPLSAPRIEPDQPRNIIIVGLDSIRRDFLTDPALQPLMPTMNAVAAAGHAELNVVSPLANTFPAWTTILTGEHPQAHGARFNLSAQVDVRTDASLAHHFRRLGYRTIYATDETRFSNVGAPFGFDEVVGPEAGVADFLLAQYVDLPLINLFVQMPRSEWLLPALAGNRAFAHAYEPSRFLRRLADSIGPADGRPTFLAVHLCADHWPFRIRESVAPLPTGTSVPDVPYYRLARVVDQQFAALRDQLRAQGYLDDRALEVVLADHGEATGDLDAKPLDLQRMSTTAIIPGPEFGHGSSLLAPAQWQVFTIFRGGSVSGAILPGRSTNLHSLEDIAPTILALSGVPASVGRSVPMAVMPMAASAGEASRRDVVVMETGLKPEGFNPANPGSSPTIRIAGRLFVVQADGRIELRQDLREAGLASKQIGVTDGRRTLVSLGERAGHLLVEQDLETRRWRTFDADRRPLPAVAAPSLIGEACRVDEFAARAVAWCRSTGARASVDALQ